MDEKMLEVIDRLTAQSRSGKVTWTDQTSTSLGSLFTATFGDVLVEVLLAESRHSTDEDEPNWVEYVRVQVRNHRGLVVASCEAGLGEPEYSRLKTLHDVALASARNKEGVLDSLLQKLGA